MKKLTLVLSLVVCAIIFSSCGEKDHVVTIKTKYGDMVAILHDETPKHKANFIKLAKEHYFDSLLFHRVIEGFMIQGGDPDSKNAAAGQQLGTGGPGYTIASEINPKFFHEKGALSAARLPDNMNPSKASSGSQFYIVQGTIATEAMLKLDPNNLNMAMQQFLQNPANKAVYDSMTVFYQQRDQAGYEKYLISLLPRIKAETGIETEKEVPADMLKAYTTVGGAPFLDNEYTVFGKVVKGLEVIDKIAAQPRDQAERPIEDIRMAVTVEEMSRSKIEKEFGYKYPEKK